MRYVWVGFAYLFLGLALVGIVLPLLPTTPFLLLAAYCATRGSERLQRWMFQHPRFGPMLQQWDERQAIPLSGKILSAVGLIAAGVVAWPRLATVPAQVALVAALLAISAYVWSRPLPVSGVGSPESGVGSRVER